MTMAKHTFLWRMSVLLVLVIGLLFALTTLERRIGNGENAFFLNAHPSLIALDQTSFHDPILFERATLLTAASLDYKAKIRQYIQSMTSITAHPKSDTLWISLGQKLIQFTPNTETVFDLRRYSKDAIEIQALTVSPLDDALLFGISKDLKIYRIHAQKNDFQIKLIGTSKDFPQNMDLSQMWANPVQNTIYVSFTNGKDSLIQAYMPSAWNHAQKEIAVPGNALYGGMNLSRDLMFLMNNKYELHVLDWSKTQYIGQYVANTNFQFSEIFKTLPIGIALSKNTLYLASSQTQLFELSWKTINNVIVLNRDIQLKKGHVALEWKMPVPKSNALYLAELTLTPRSLASEKEKKIKQKAFGPLHQGVLKIPYFETAYRQFDMNVMAIDQKSGRLLTPAMAFTIETGGLKSW
ncbi:MAG: hypothetical protein A3B70_03060 [Deltaproteobacteria bacterium RIFCSPHIGHO2_02_FULL_40_11]|nr:MAG: hypothetical protein A3B70_03060 [Deltaproteobacteria bacterium RIFCSPHIGHO2_02_FULL_40_11]